MSQTNNYALITGATEGIGYELAKLFAKDNYNLVIVAAIKSFKLARASSTSNTILAYVEMVCDKYSKLEHYTSKYKNITLK